MGFMDKVKAQADQAMTKAQHGLAQGQSKIEEMQAKRAADALLRQLGVATYAVHQGAGSQADVDEAIAALDKHVAEHGPIGAPADSDS
jgi:hypothetical protein